MTSDAPVVFVIVAVVVLVESIWTGFARVVMSLATQSYVVEANATGHVITAALEAKIECPAYSFVVAAAVAAEHVWFPDPVLPQ